MEHYLDFLSLLQEGLQQQVGGLIKSSLGDLGVRVEGIQTQTQRLGPDISPGVEASGSSLRCEGNEVGASTPDLWHVCHWIHTREHSPLLFGDTGSPSLWGAPVSLILDVLHFQSRDLMP